MSKQLTFLKYDDSDFDFSKRRSSYDDKIKTKLVLEDNSWMHYTFECWFPTKNQGDLWIVATYSGYGMCDAEITQTIDGKKYIHKFNFSNAIWKRFIISYMKKHLEQWTDGKFFYGGGEAISFYNDMLTGAENYTIKDVAKEPRKTRLLKDIIDW